MFKVQHKDTCKTKSIVKIRIDTKKLQKTCLIFQYSTTM